MGSEWLTQGTTLTEIAERVSRIQRTVTAQSDSPAKRLGGNALGVAPWSTTRLEAIGKPTIEVTATPCRHGPPGSRPITGDVVGFALRWDGQENGLLWISGDTVLYGGVREVADGSTSAPWFCTWVRCDSASPGRSGTR